MADHSAAQTTTGYARMLAESAWRETCELVFGSRFLTFIIGTLATAFGFYLRWVIAKTGFDMTDALVGLLYAACANAVIFLLIFGTHFLYVTPKRYWEKAQLIQANAKSKQQREAIRNKLYDYLFGIEDRLEHLRRMDAQTVVMFDMTSPPRDDEKLINEIFDYINKNIGLSYAGEFLSSTGLSQARNPSAHTKQMEMLSNRAMRLKSIVDKY